MMDATQVYIRCLGGLLLLANSEQENIKKNQQTNQGYSTRPFYRHWETRTAQI